MVHYYTIGIRYTHYIIHTNKNYNDIQVGYLGESFFYLLCIGLMKLIYVMSLIANIGRH